MALAAALAGCSSDSGGDATTPKTIEITINGSDVTPNGDRVQVAVNQEVDLEITADKAGSLHVHSDPEQTLPYKQGETSVKIAINRPGIVAVESHALNKVIVQLEVR